MRAFLFESYKPDNHGLYWCTANTLDKKTLTLIEVWVKGGEDRRVTEVPHLGLLSLQVGNAQIEGERLGGARGTHNDQRGVCGCADNSGKKVLLEGLSLGNASGEFHLLGVPVQFITKCL